jgi:hypothetical protein
VVPPNPLPPTGMWKGSGAFGSLPGAVRQVCARVTVHALAAASSDARFTVTVGVPGCVYLLDR